MWCPASNGIQRRVTRHNLLVDGSEQGRGLKLDRAESVGDRNAVTSRVVTVGDNGIARRFVEECFPGSGEKSPRRIEE